MKLVWRIIYRLYRFVSRLRHSVTRRFTHPGIAVLLALVAAATLGFDTDNTVAYQAFALLTFLVLFSIVFGFRFKTRFAASRRLPRFGTVGKPLHYRVSIRNLSRKPQTGLVLLENLPDPRPSFNDWLAVQVAEDRLARSFRFDVARRRNPFRIATVRESPLPDMPSNGEVETTIQVTPLRRGVLRLEGLTVASADPLGLFRGFSMVTLPQSVLILPKRYPLSPVALPGTLKYQEGGVAMASNVGRSEEFVSLRDYRRGDPPRHIHWRSWAKTGIPIVKEFEDEFFVRHALILDTFTNVPHGDTFEEAVAIAASFACTVLTQESLLDLLFVGAQAYCFTAGRGLAHADQMLEILASVRACPDKSFSSLEHLVFNHAAAVSGCICVLLTWDEERQNLVRKLRSFGVPVKVLVVVSPSDDTHLDPGPMRDEPGHFHVLRSDRVEQELAGL
ncbi:MAG TPA: DUF58 domain-containing protein [Verrucomicrobiota bacterium]|nr:DUF58 domain-containing protein [Verrucomicrobiota bacterium]